MAKPNSKTTRVAAAPARKRAPLEYVGARICAGYEVIVKLATTDPITPGPATKARGQGERA